MSFWDRFKFTKKPFQQQPAASPKKEGAVASASTRPAAFRPEREDTGTAGSVLLRPLVTEKTARLAARGQYGFIVGVDANRRAVAEAVHAVYGIRPVRVSIANVRGKEVRFGNKIGRRKDWKKAFVTLPPGKKIAVYEGV